jgi:hypothetical protein
MTATLWARPSRKEGRRLRRVKILVDEETFFRYREKDLKIRPNKLVYFREGKECKYLKREILHLTDSKDRVFFKSNNTLDMRKTNLKLNPVPKTHRGRYCVQIRENTQK